MKPILLATTLLALLTAPAGAASNDFVTVKPEPSAYAWWLRADFHPSETQVRGIPVKQIRATWCKANEFRKELFPPDLAADFKQPVEISFSYDRSFDGSKVPQTALVGVYEGCDGHHGSFLLILARPPGKPPTVRFLQEFTDIQFGILAVTRDATIAVFHCLECDNFTRFRWSRAKKQFVQVK